jgi:hypothetical protein
LALAGLRRYNGAFFGLKPHRPGGSHGIGLTPMGQEPSAPIRARNGHGDQRSGDLAIETSEFGLLEGLQALRIDGPGKAYVYWVRWLVRFHFCGIRDKAAAEVEAILTMLATERRVSSSTHNQALSALLFLYREVLGAELPWLDGMQRPSRPKRIPVGCWLARK